MKSLGAERGEDFYIHALECAQSLWLQGLPAQSILLMNRAFSSDLGGSEGRLSEWPLPYEAMKWVMSERTDDQFIGNPRRHFQHLATRMVEPRKELRSWRAWACWWLACQVFPDYLADEEQLANEPIAEPSFSQIRGNLLRIGLPGESEKWEGVADEAIRPSQEL
tara:strand:- start:301 stop:795 length:495 start_codon:yes stop_codon:yes gene_type:complete